MDAGLVYLVRTVVVVVVMAFSLADFRGLHPYSFAYQAFKNDSNACVGII